MVNVDDMVILSIDDHTIEPPDLFANHLPASYRDRAPRLVSNAEGKERWEFEGKEFGVFALNATVTWPKEEWGLNPSALAEMRPAAYLVDERIRDMDRNGVLAAHRAVADRHRSGRDVQQALVVEPRGEHQLRVPALGGQQQLSARLLEGNCGLNSHWRCHRHPGGQSFVIDVFIGHGSSRVEREPGDGVRSI